MSRSNQNLYTTYGQPYKSNFKQPISSKTTFVNAVQQNHQNHQNLSQYQQYEKQYQSKIQNEYYPIGLKNIGNNCYMNSVIQILFHIKQFRDSILQFEIKKSTSPVTICIKLFNIFIQALKDLFQSLRDWKLNQTVDPSMFYQTFLQLHKNFEFGRQEDANEFLLQLLDNIGQDTKYQIKEEFNFIDWISNIFDSKPNNAMNEYWKQQRERESNLVTQSFVGLYENQIICQSCKYTQKSYEEFNSINIALDSKQNTQFTITLRELLQNHFSENVIKNYQCNKCNQIMNFQRTRIAKFPTILVFSFKRFSYNSLYKAERINTSISFQIDLLRMQEFSISITNQANYKLIGIIHHLGTCEHGHYYASGLCANNKWYRFDDSQVSEISLISRGYDTIGSQTPYMLIYQYIQ